MDFVIVSVFKMVTNYLINDPFKQNSQKQKPCALSAYIPTNLRLCDSRTSVSSSGKLPV